MKKLFILCLIILLLMLGVSAVFVDVPSDAYYADAAERMADRGILSGFGDDRFYGDWELTRAQFAALACKMLGKVDEAAALAGKTVFTDVPETHWSTGYVNYASANKIINGDGDGNFRPDDPVKYEEAIKVIICVIEPNNNIKIDKDDWSKNFISEAKKLGLTDNLIGKKGEPLKRSDIAVIADKGMSYLDEKNQAEETSITTRKDTGVSKPSTGSKNEEPTITTTEKTTVKDSFVTTANSGTTSVEYTNSPPPPPGEYEGLEA